MFKSPQEEYEVIPEQFNQVLATQQGYNMLKQNHLYNGWNLYNQNSFDRNILNNSTNNFYDKPKQFNSFVNANQSRKTYWIKNKHIHNKSIGNLNDNMLVKNGVSENVNNNSKVDVNDGGVNNSEKSNSKEKSPMCLINELARYYKVNPVYNLINEEGPAHKKIFHVQLQFGDEEFTSSGPSIKKAQHAVASEALKNTKCSHPPTKNDRQTRYANKKDNPSLTPTVELNSLAMKRGEVATYQVVGGFKGHKLIGYKDNALIKRSFSNAAFEVEVTVGSKTFRGEGYSMMMARHDAASKAIDVIKKEMETRKDSSEQTADDSSKCESAPTVDNKASPSDSKRVISKSEISQVYEIAFKRKYTVTFEVVKESGPPHMKVYITRCKCGEVVVDGEGNSKKTSKKQSAVKMIQELNKLSPLPMNLSTEGSDKPNKKFHNKHKSNKNNIKVKKPNPDCGAGINPVSRLIQILQAKKQAEPQFKITEEGYGRDREFQVQVVVGNQQASACASSKKLAKKLASEKMLLLLGFSRPSPITSQMNPTTTNSSSTTSTNKSNEKKVTFNDVAQVTLVSNDPPLSNNILTFCPIQQLQYLGRTYGFLVQFRDIPKTVDMAYNFVSLVTLTTNPPQHSHGEGRTIEESQKVAAFNAIKQLTELGLDGFGSIPNFQNNE